MAHKRKTAQILARVAELLVVLAIIKNGPLSVVQLRHHWSINKLSLLPALNRLIEKGDIRLVNGKYRLVPTASQALAPYLRPPILMQSEADLVNLALVNCYLTILEMGHEFIKPTDAWAGPFAPCTKQSWPYVARTLSLLGLASLLDPSALNWQDHPAFANRPEEEE